MKTVILAAGEGTRMRPLTYTKPKPLLKVTNKSLLQHNLEQVKDAGIDNVIIVVGHHGEKIKEFFGMNFDGMEIDYIVQKDRLGTGHALLQVKESLEKNDRFLLMNGDDLYNSEDIGKCLKHDLCVMAKEVSNPEEFGVFVMENNAVKDLVEKPKEYVSNLANIGLYSLDKSIFPILENLKNSVRNEIEVTDAIRQLILDRNFSLEIAKEWMPIGYPWDLLNSNEFLIKNIEKQDDLVNSNTIIESNTILTGPIKVGKNTRIKSGAYIEGPVIIGEDCSVGPNCYIRQGTVIGDNCKIGNAVEIKNSIIGNGTRIEHLSYIGDSVVGQNCNFGAGTITANLRHDNKPVKVVVKGELVNTNRRKFGAVFGDYCKTGINSSINPGALIGPCSWSTAHSFINKNVEPFKMFDGEEKLIDVSNIDLIAKSETDIKLLKDLFKKITREKL